jgi:hypothetical protein
MTKAPALAVFAALAAFGAACKDRTPDKAPLMGEARAYFDLVGRGDAPGAYAELSAASRSLVSEEEFARDLGGEPHARVPRVLAIRVPGMDASAALVEYDVWDGTAPMTPQLAYFVKEAGEWKRAYDRPFAVREEEAERRGDFLGALAALKRRLAVNPRNAMAYDALCRLELAHDDVRNALGDCKASAELFAAFPFDPDQAGAARLRYARALAEAGRGAEASVQEKAAAADRAALGPRAPDGDGPVITNVRIKR